MRPTPPCVPGCADMDWLQAPDYWLTRLVIERALGVIYFVAFLVAVNQFRPLLGEKGLLPVPLFLSRVSFLQAPSLFHLRYSDRLLLGVTGSGLVLSLAVVAGLPDVAPAWLAILIWFALWVLYQSIVNVGQIFYAFGWETLLLEAGFLAIFLGAGPTLVLTQAWLVLSGNFSWLNFLTMTLAFSAFDDRALSLFLTVHVRHLEPLPIWWQWLVIAVTLLVVVLSYRPVLNLISPNQLMNFSFDPFHLVNTYGAFGSVTKERYEIVVQGTASSEPAGGERKAYEFKGKPGDPRRVPRQYAPYHLRLDWLMWFAAMESPYRHQWFIAFLIKLLEGDRATLRLLGYNPFPDRPPASVRAMLYRYRFSTLAELRAEGAWWVRTPVADYFPALVLDAAGNPARLNPSRG